MREHKHAHKRAGKEGARCLRKARAARGGGRTDPQTGRPLRDRRLVPNVCLRQLIEATRARLHLAPARTPAATNSTNPAPDPARTAG